MATAVAPSAVVLTNSRRETGVFIKSLGGPASVDGDGCAGDVARGVGREENDEAVNFVHFTPATHGDFGDEGLVGFRIFQKRLVHLSAKWAGANRVYGDAVFGEFERLRFGEEDEAGFARGV